MTDTPYPATAVLLAGGRSRRMGSDKAQLDVDGTPLLLWRVGALRARFAEVLVVTPAAAPSRALDVSAHGASWVDDGGAPGEGPLAGLLGGLAAAAHPHVYLTGVDLPDLVWPVVEALLARLEGDPALDVVAAATSASGPLEPLLSVLRVRALGPLRASFAAGERSLRRALAALQHARLDPAPLDPDLRSLQNLNEPADLERWLRGRQRRFA